MNGPSYASKCPSCSAALPPGAVSCPACGKFLGSARVVEPASQGGQDAAGGNLKPSVFLRLQAQPPAVPPPPGSTGPRTQATLGHVTPPTAASPAPPSPIPAPAARQPVPTPALPSTGVEETATSRLAGALEGLRSVSLSLPSFRGKERIARVGVALVAVVAVSVGLLRMASSAPARTTIFGHAYVTGPLAQANVELRMLDEHGKAGSLLTTAMTDLDGRFEVSIERQDASLLVTTSGGSFMSTASRKSVTARPADRLQTIISPWQRASAVTPLTTLATARALQLAGSGDDVNLNDAVDAAFIATARQFNVATIVDESPVLIDDAARVPLASRTSRELGLILSGLEREASLLGVPAVALTNAVAEDLADGFLDGKNGTAVVMIDGKKLLPADATTAGLQAAINKVAASTANKTRLPAPQVATSVPQLKFAEGAESPLYVRTTVLEWEAGHEASVSIEGRTSDANRSCLLVEGSLPKGFSLSPECVITGGKTTTLGKNAVSFSAPFTIAMSDDAQPPQSTRAQLRITIVGEKPTLTALTAGKCPAAGVDCDLPIVVAAGGVKPHAYTTAPFVEAVQPDRFAPGPAPSLAFVGPTLPDGMSIKADGTLTGKPASSGRYTFRICVVDVIGSMACAPVTIEVG